MILFDEQKQFAFYPQRCCQCGACLAVCPTGALSMEASENGLFKIECDDSLCVGCLKCEDVCPAKDLTSSVLTDEEWTKVSSSFLAFSKNSNARFSSSSGGVVRTLIRLSLEKEIVDYVYCAVKTNHFPFAKGGYLQKGSDLSVIVNSTYMSFPLLLDCKLLSPGTKLLAVGTNCQLLAFDRFYENSNIELTKIALFCKQQKHIGYTQYLHKTLNKSFLSIKQLSYRGEGWPGLSRIENASVNYARFAALPFGKRLWNVPACSVCSNALATSADISIGDPWEIVTEEEARGGMSLCVVLSEQGDSLVKAAYSDLSFKLIDLNLVKKSIGWTQLKKRVHTIPARIHQSRNLRSKIRVFLFDMQCCVLEHLLSRVTLSQRFLRILSRVLPSE